MARVMSCPLSYGVRIFQWGFCFVGYLAPFRSAACLLRPSLFRVPWRCAVPSRSERVFYLMRSPAPGVVGAVREGFLEASLVCLAAALVR